MAHTSITSAEAAKTLLERLFYSGSFAAASVLILAVEYASFVTDESLARKVKAAHALERQCSELSALLRSPLLGDSPTAESSERLYEHIVSLLALAPKAEGLQLAFARALIEGKRYEAAVRVLRSLERARRAGDSAPGPDTRNPWTIDFHFPQPLCESAVEAIQLSAAGTAGYVPVSSEGSDRISVTVTGVDLPSLPVLLAYAQARAGDLPAAISTLTTAVQGDPDGSTQDGKGAGAMLKAVRAINDAKDRANELYKAGKHEEAVAAYGEGQELARKRLGVSLSFFHSNAAAALMALSRYDDALSECMSAIRAFPANSKAWARAAVCFSSVKPAQYDLAAAATAACQYLTPEEAQGIGKSLLAARTKAGDESVDGHSPHVLEAISGLVCPLLHPQADGEYQSMLTDWKGQKGRKAGAKVIIPIFTGSDASSRDVLASSRVQLVDFFATWCGPCKQIAPLFTQLAAQVAPITFVKVDGDRCKASASGMGAPPAKEASSGDCKPASGQCCGGGGCGSAGKQAQGPGGAVRAFPTFCLFVDGQEISRMEGADPSKLSSMIKEGLQALARSPPMPPTHVKIPAVPGVPSTTAPAPGVLQEALMAKDGRADIMGPVSSAMRVLGLV